MEKIMGIKNEKGITIIELLAVISLFSIVMLLASSVHLFGQKQMNTQRNEIQTQTQERLAANIITKEIRKADIVEVNNPNELTINGIDYKLEGTTIKKDDEEFITNISSFNVKKDGKRVTVKIGNLPETVIYIRE